LSKRSVFERFFLQPLIPAFRISELIFEKRYSVVVKKRSVFERFFLQPLIPAFRISELIFEKRYKNQITANCSTPILFLDLKLNIAYSK
jgi:hypothetical protein